MRPRNLESELWVPRPRGEVFAFFADAGNLDRITPPWLHFRILTPLPLRMRQGARIDYRLKLHQIPITWRTEIALWEPPHQFRDVQLRGPYLYWAHEHLFVEERGGTRVVDRVTYAVPGGPLEPLLHRLLVRPDLEMIFAYRRRRIQALLS